MAEGFEVETRLFAAAYSVLRSLELLLNGRNRGHQPLLDQDYRAMCGELRQALDFAGSGTPDQPEQAARRSPAAALLRKCAAASREYLSDGMPEDQRLQLEAESRMIDAAAQIVEGYVETLRWWLPSWLWAEPILAGRNTEPEN